MNKHIIQYIAAFIVIVGFFSCATRHYERPSLDMPDNYRSTDSISTDYIAMNDSGIATVPYKSFFDNKELVTLIDSGIARNYDLQTAIKQIAYSQEALKQAKLGNIPTVSFTAANASITRSSDNSLNGSLASQFLGKSYVTDYTSYLGISWEADIWGKIKNRKSAALAAYLQTEEAKKAVQTQLVASIAQGYYNLLLLDEQQRITENSIRLYDSTIQMTKVLQESGSVNELAVQQQEAAREAAKATLPQIEQQIAVQENALKVLTGDNPGKISRGNSLEMLHPADALSTGYPANIVSNRPDVKQAELGIVQALGLENVAHASMYPSLNISAQGGLDAVDFKNWFNIPGSLFGAALGGITAPVFQGRQLKTQYRQAKISTDIAELQFKKSVQTALQEVSNALVETDKLKSRETYLQNQVTLLTGAVANARLLFANGQSNYLDVLTAQGNLLQARLTLAAVKSQRLDADVTLYQALGGGWK
ncbi:hypothetical protein A9P82_09300 [Arachidicoccus ginsenosidimutans]|uniref:TolC family protein n=1 Tax=Arachidicoccus sp. BS20 TaxID=1850526 RepID=UPI0007F0830B|nr:efflux transporter outer membrane subunit [Arachidicoccus sp. BS20]ANI90704.1 hypothetical protein A9P82_09300 [Arachidicoccus sp. BS20]